MTEQTLNDPEPQQAEAAPPHQAEAGGDPRQPASPVDSLGELRREKDALHDRLLRTAAEFDNYRKRVDRERRDLADHLKSDILADLLPILDNFERALLASSGNEAEPLRKGVELIYKQMVDFLRKRGVTPIEALGADFDPNFHQAVIHEASPSHREGEVIEELQRGYMVGEKLLRPSMVKVAKSA